MKLATAIVALLSITGCGRYVRTSAGPTFGIDDVGLEVAVEVGTHALALEGAGVPIGLRTQLTTFADESIVMFGMTLGDDVYSSKDGGWGGRFAVSGGADTAGQTNIRTTLAAGRLARRRSLPDVRRRGGVAGRLAIERHRSEGGNDRTRWDAGSGERRRRISALARDLRGVPPVDEARSWKVSVLRHLHGPVAQRLTAQAREPRRDARLEDRRET
jgi:hypothetical protein